MTAASRRTEHHKRTYLPYPKPGSLGEEQDPVTGLYVTPEPMRAQDLTLTCATCGMSFATHDLFKRHNRVHTGEKKFVCDIEGCGKLFARSDKYVIAGIVDALLYFG